MIDELGLNAAVKCYMGAPGRSEVRPLVQKIIEAYEAARLASQEAEGWREVKLQARAIAAMPEPVEVSEAQVMDVIQNSPFNIPGDEVWEALRKAGIRLVWTKAPAEGEG